MSYLKKTLAIFLMVCMLASMMPVGTAYAAEDSATPTEATAGGSAPEGGSDAKTKSADNGTAADPAANADTVDPSTCTHEWADAGDGSTNRKCSKCGATCTHNGCFNHDGLCTFCGYQCPHTGTWTASSIDPKNSVCSACGAVCTHTVSAEGGTVSTFKDGICEICGLACTHPTVEDVAEVKATCTEAGHEAGKKCTVCGAYTEGGAVIPALGHKWDYTDAKLAKCLNGCGETCSHEKTADGTTTTLFENGTCSVCGYVCPHTKADGSSAFDANSKCELCGQTCAHKWNTSDKAHAVCEICKATCDHTAGFDFASKCTNCGYECKHENLNGDHCDDCNLSFVASVTKSDGSIKYYTVTGEDTQSDIYEGYLSLQEGSTLKLLADITLKDYILFKNKNMVLDLNGKTLTGPASGLAVYLNGGSLAIRNGTIVSGGYRGSGLIYAAGGATLTIEKTATVNGKEDHGIFIAKEGTKAEIYGTVLSDNEAAITGNGSADYAGTIINVYDGAVLTSTNGTAIYHPQQRGVLNIKGGTITGGEAGVEVRAGTANISGGVIEGKGDPFAATPNGSGSTTVGAGLAIVQHSTKCAITVNITGGTLIGKRAIYEANHSNSTPEELSLVSINVTGGTLKGEVFSSDDKITFSGAAKDTVMPVPTTEDAANPNAVVADASFIHAGANNEITTGAKTEAVISKKALLECASSSDTIVTVDTNEATVSLDAAALKKIDGAVAENGSATVHVEKVSETADGKTFEVYVTDAAGNKIGSGTAGALGGKAAVVLKGITTEPKQVRHYDLNADNSYQFLEVIEKPGFTYDADQDTVTVSIDHFSYLVTSMSMAPVIDQASLTAPNAWTGSAYEHQLAASGDATIQWRVVSGSLPDGLTLGTDGKLSGTVNANAALGDYTVTVRAENGVGYDEAELTITVQEYFAAIVCDMDDQGNPVEGTEDTYPTVQDAVEAAADGQLVIVVEDTNENVVVEGKYVTIVGDVEGRRLGSITVRADAQGEPGIAGVGNIAADSVTVEKGSGAALVVGNDIKSVVNRNTVGNVDNPDPFVVIDGGHYGALSPAESGSYLVTSGTFDKEIPMEYCREIDAQGNMTQRFARYNTTKKVFEIVPFTFEITGVSNSGYHMPGSEKTLVFSTNLDYKLADRDRSACTIAVTSGTSSKPISSVYYDITEKDGKAQITLKASTLNRLALGRYTLTYDGPTGKDSMYFHISNTVKTGDTSNIGLWMGIMGVSVVVLCAVAAVLAVKSKKKKGGAKKKDEK